MSWIVLGAIVFWGGSMARAQDNVDDLQFFAPAEVTSYGGGYPRQRQGWFGEISWQRVTITSPAVTDIGIPNGSAIVASGELGGNVPNSFPNVLPGFFPTQRGRLETNTIDTSKFGSDFANGNRIEFGNVEGHLGWLVGLNLIHPQTSSITAENVDVVFGDPLLLQPFFDVETGLISLRPVGLLDGFINTGVVGIPNATDDSSLDRLIPPATAFGTAQGRSFDLDGDGVADGVLPESFKDLNDLSRLPVVFEQLKVRNVVKVKGIEIMPFYRFDQLQGGSNFELGLGLRYTKFDEEFDVRGTGGILDESRWSTRAENNIVGPQLMGRWSKTLGHFNFSAEGRGFFGINFQNIRQNGTIASSLNNAVAPASTTSRANNLPAIFNATSFNNGLHADELAPAVELRADVSYTVTKSIALRAGWTGTWQDGLARPSNMVNYQLPSLGILGNENTQSLFINGYTLGVEINR